MVERVAAGPIDKPRFRIGVGLAVIGKFRARIQQHVTDPGHRNEALHRIAPLRQRRKGNMAHIVADMVGNGIAEPEPAPRQADLAKHGGKRNGGPIGLLAILLAGQRPADRYHGTAGSHAPGQPQNGIGIDSGQRRCPKGVLRNAVNRAI